MTKGQGPVVRETAAIRGYRLSQRARTWAFTRFVSAGFAGFGTGSSITPPVSLGRASHVRIGGGVVLGPHCILRVLGDPAPGAVLIDIEDGVSIVGTCSISAVQSVVIEAGALFARNVYIADHAHAYDDPQQFVKHQGIRNVAPVRIGRGAWLGENVVISPGVTIGAGAVVGANSLVRHDVPAYSLAAGCPARVLKSWAPTEVLR